MNDRAWNQSSILAQIFVGILLCVGYTTLPPRVHAEETDERGPRFERPRLVVIGTKGYQPAPVTSLTKEGEKAFRNLNCMQCHSIHNAGGTLGPLLDGVGCHRSKDYLLAHLIDDDKERQAFARLAGGDPTFISPHPRIRSDSAKLIVEYLLTLPEPVGGFVVVPHVTRDIAEAPSQNPQYKPLPASASSQLGSHLYSQFGCAACHSIGNVGGWVGPNLDGVGGRRTRPWIVTHVSNPTVHAGPVDELTPPEQMPTFPIAKADVEKIVDYLMTIPNL